MQAILRDEWILTNFYKPSGRGRINFRKEITWISIIRTSPGMAKINHMDFHNQNIALHGKKAVLTRNPVYTYETTDPKTGKTHHNIDKVSDKITDVQTSVGWQMKRWQEVKTITLIDGKPEKPAPVKKNNRYTWT